MQYGNTILRQNNRYKTVYIIFPVFKYLKYLREMGFEKSLLSF